MKQHNRNRREFLKRSLGVALGSSTVFSTLSTLSTLKAAALAERMHDYKALVCIFLKGGNDSMNMVVPTESAAYSQYAASRTSMGQALDTLVPLNGVPFGFSPDSAPFAQLFNEGELAIVGNVGSLVEPVSKANIQSGGAQLPIKLFSHNDQQRLWMQADATGVASTGWAGRIADLLMDSGVGLGPSLNYGFGSADFMQRGASVQPFGLADNGVIQLRTAVNADESRTYGRYVRHAAQGLESQHPLVREYAQVLTRSMDKTDILADALAAAPALQTEFTDFNGHTFASQLRTTARLIAANQLLGAKRQIFFIPLGGWDTHDAQLGRHSLLQQILTTNLSEFFQELKALGVENSVTTFTSSEFGRTLSSNGTGTDHGWGGHSFVLGGAVKGGKIYGQMPDLALGGDDDFGSGRIIPSLSSDQYNATLSKWFGLESGEVNEVFPLLSNFDSGDLGFMA